MSEADFIIRPGRYVRKRDGYTVVACDWPDGDVSWRLEPLPMCLPHLSMRAVGTCRAETFAKNHTPLPATTGE